MKQKLLFLLALIAFMLPAPLSAYEFESGGIYYNTTWSDVDGTSVLAAEVTSSPDDNLYSGDIVIPSTVEYNGQELQVTSIGYEAFSGCSSLTSVKLTTSLTSIGECAFMNCISLTAIELPTGLTSIGFQAFAGCSSLTSVKLPAGLTSIGEWAFNLCSSLTAIELPASLTSIGDGAFSVCSSLTAIELPSGLTSIGSQAFEGCSSLTSIELPAALTSIRERTFAYCYNLRVFVIRGENTTFGGNVFEGSSPWYIFAPEGFSALSSGFTPYNSETTTFLSDGTILTDNGKTLLCAPIYYGKDYVIPEGVAKIPAGVFACMDCADPIIGTLTIPSSIEEIEPDAFYSTRIEKVNFTDWPKWYANVKLGNLYSNPYRECGAYAGGVRIAAPELKEGITEIKDYINCGLEYKGDIALPSTLKRIGAYAFYNNNELLSVEMPQELEEIGDYAFSGCERMKSAMIPESVSTIGQEAFSGCNNLSFVIINNSATQIEPNAFAVSDFWGTGIHQFFCPEDMDISSLELSSFNVNRFNPEDSMFLSDGTHLNGDGTKLLYVAVREGSYSIPEGVVTITADAFRNVNSLESLTIPASVAEVEADAFMNVNIARVDFEDWDAWYANVKLGNLYANPYREGQAYADGSKIKSIELKEGLTQIGDYVNYGLDIKFKDEIELPSTLKLIGAYAFTNCDELYAVFIPSGVERIGDYAFSGCKLLENVELPAGLKTIGESAFSGCTSMTEVELPESLTSLGAGAYSYCSAIEKATLVCDIDTIGDYTFSECSVLNKIYFPLNLKRIGNSAFLNCTALDEVVFPASLESIGEQAFEIIGDSKGNLTKLVIPNSVTELGYAAFGNQKIANLTIGTGLKSIPACAFIDNSLKVINLSEGLTSIGKLAFASYSYSWNLSEPQSISSVKIPDSVTEIAQDAFSKTRITELEIPDGVTALPSGSCGVPSILTLGSGVKEIDSNAFSFENLKVIRLKAITPPSLSDAFPLTTDQNDALTLIVNNGRKDKYTTNARWKQIDHIIEEGSADVVIYMTGDYAISEEIRTTTGIMPSQVTKMKVVGPLTQNDLRIIKENMVSLQSLDMSEVSNVTAIPASQFENSLLSEIILPANTESIGNDAFANCQLLKLSELPETVKTIGASAFANCPGVTISNLPEALESIEGNAFANCTGLREIKADSNLANIGRWYGDGGVFSGCTLLEKVDFSASQLTNIPSYMFSGCRELDEIILPESVVSIGDGAFNNTAIRDIAFASGVKEIGQGAFSNCRRLVAANLSDKTEYVSGNMFANCPRLISVSMPSATTRVAENIVNGDKKLSNISCAALDAPTADNGAFDNIRLRYVSLTVPTLSFRSYLNAPQWGKFENILNRIPVSIDPGVEVTNVAEAEYQDMLKEDALEEAQELASQEREEQGEEPVQVMRRVARRAQARTATNRSFATLFDGAQIQTGTEGAGTRIFINPKEGVNITSVKYAGKEMIDQLQGNTLLLPAGSNGTLEIRTDAPQDPNIGVGIGEINYDEPYEVYDLNGFHVGDSLKTLLPGLYVVRQGHAVKKVAIK